MTPPDPQRRRFLAAGLLAALASGSVGRRLAAEPQAPSLPWRNWSGNQHSQPTRRFAPTSEAELIEFLRTHADRCRPVGSGHSFSALVPTNDTLVVLARMTGMVDPDPASLQATFLAGTRMADMGEPLHAAGQALFNMADIDRQTLAGALSTATHGTGADLHAIHGYVKELRLVTPAGDVIDCSADRNTEVFHAARVGLGSLGFLTRIRLQNRPAYRLKQRSWAARTDEILDQFPQLIRQHRHFEIFPLLHSDFCLAQAIDETDEAITGKPLEETSEDGESGFAALVAAGALPVPERRAQINAAAEAIAPTEYVDLSHRILANVRSTRFNEMEFSVPAERGIACLREVLDTVANTPFDVIFPLEFRYVRADDAWLSMFQGGDRYAISVHDFWQRDYRPYFEAMQAIFLRHGGRPHWGKVHFLPAAELARLYPHWQDFQQVRRRLDPAGRMLNDHLRSVLGAA